MKTNEKLSVIRNPKATRCHFILNDEYERLRIITLRLISDHVANEVAMDYNAGFQSLLAGLKKKVCP